MALMQPAVDDAIRSGLVSERVGRVELSEHGRERFTAFVQELGEWLTREVEQANGEPLEDQGREDLRAIARRVLLSEDPVSEPMEIAQAGG